MGNGPVLTYAVAPRRVLRGATAAAELGPHVADLGSTPLLVHGEHGVARLAAGLRAGLGGAGAAPTEVLHRGLVTQAAIERLADRARAGRHDVVIGVGGGRVIDVAKAAAAVVGTPFVAVPTSPATCAATTSIAVQYEESGAWSRPIDAGGCPALVVLDAATLVAAPDRLLAAGVLDAWCKVAEVRLATRAAPRPDALLDAALAVCDALAAHVDPETGALATGLPRDRSERAALAEATIMLPGLIAGLAGEGNKLAAAHAVHNAFTRIPDHHGALHGELVAFGVLVQLALDGVDDRVLAERVGWIRRLGVDPSLEALGCAGYARDPEPILRWLLAAPALRRAFPNVDARSVAATIEHVDRIAARA